MASQPLFPDLDAADNRLQAPLADAFGTVLPAWRTLCAEFLASATGQGLCAKIDRRIEAGATVFPARPLRALSTLEPADVKVVILGQDPYHGAGQAEGLAFSVPPGVPIPPSLRNIHNELRSDLGLVPPNHGSLVRWIGQGVLLLNTILTVEQDRPGSHSRLGWHQLTDDVIGCVATDAAPKVFLLWGAHAQTKEALIGQSTQRHLILRSNHPSPLSARRPPVPFLGSAPFSRASAWLDARGRGAIDWQL